MMKLTTSQYACMLIFQTILFWVDFGINAFGQLARSNVVMIILLVLQVACIVLAISSLLITFFSTYVFQAGLVELLYDRFRCTLVVCFLYFILTTTAQIWTIVVRWNTGSSFYEWPVGLAVVTCIQRIFSPLYYYYFKRTALRLSDPRFYVDIMWDKQFPDNTVQYQNQ